MGPLRALCLSSTLLCGTLTGCRRNEFLVRRATWTCVSQRYPSADANVQTVEFRFVDDPREFEVDPGMLLCDELREADEPVVELRFIKVRGTFGLHGGAEKLESIDSRSYQPAAGWGHNGYGRDMEGPQ